MSTSTTPAASLTYHEPPITLILIHTSFLILLNTLNYVLDRLLYCGLIGQIIIGIAWGTPGAALLPTDFEHAVVQLGYLGLLLLVYEGGLATSFPSLRANIHLSVGVALTGIAAPMGLSFILGPLLGATPVHCFAAGAALCSTSLGTTFAVLRASGMAPTRLGVVLASAAMLDDVVGLVMVQVISNLSSGEEAGGTIEPVVVIRPVLVSLGFALVAALSCWLVLRPVTGWMNAWRSRAKVKKTASRGSLLDGEQTALVVHTALLVGLVSAASYAGTSTLLAAYIAGAVISWWDSEVPHLATPIAEPTRVEETTAMPLGAGDSITSPSSATTRDGNEAASTPPARGQESREAPEGRSSGHGMFTHYYAPAVKWILQPFFFASIGFSIPITRMFAGPIVWKGVVYAILMVLGKVVCGLWLIRLPSFTMWIRSAWKNHVPDKGKATARGNESSPGDSRSPNIPDQAADPSGDAVTEPKSTPEAHIPSSSPPAHPHIAPSPTNPLSLYPAAILGLAMVPRGEIGFLISSIAQSNGTFGGTGGESDVFLVVTWAIFLCTIVGPVCVGLLVRRVRRLENGGQEGPQLRTDVLGVWGVS